ncbi:DB domain-containing protein, partial [Meloidogyne graminicola]
CISLGGCSSLSGYPEYQKCLTSTGATYFRNCFGGICKHQRLKGSELFLLNGTENISQQNGKKEEKDFEAIQLRSMFLNSDDCPIESASIIHFCASQNQDHRECCLRAGIDQTKAGPKCLLFCDQMPTNETLLDLSYLPCFERFSEMKNCFYENSLRTIDYLEAEMKQIRKEEEYILNGNKEENNNKIFQTSNNPLIFINDVREKYPLINDDYAFNDNIINNENYNNITNNN